MRETQSEKERGTQHSGSRRLLNDGREAKQLEMKKKREIGRRIRPSQHAGLAL